MSYTKMMKWNSKHRKGTNQPIIMSTGSGFWPSGAFLKKYFEYRDKCEAAGINPAECEDYYHNTGYYNDILNTKKQTHGKD